LIRGSTRARPRSRVEGITWVNLSQCMEKSGYYHSFKTSLRNWPEAKFKSRVRRVNLANPFVLKIIIKITLFWPNFFSKKSTCFWLVFYLELTWILDRFRSSFLNILLNSDQSKPGINLSSQSWFYNPR
jgi:hypothetical protein